MYNVYICVWGCSYRLRPPTLPHEHVSQIHKLIKSNQSTIVKILNNAHYCFFPINATESSCFRLQVSIVLVYNQTRHWDTNLKTGLLKIFTEATASVACFNGCYAPYNHPFTFSLWLIDHGGRVLLPYVGKKRYFSRFPLSSYNVASIREYS